MNGNFNIDTFLWIATFLEIICLIVSLKCLLVEPKRRKTKIIRLISITSLIILNAIQLPIRFKQTKISLLMIPWIIFLFIDACVILYDLPGNKDE